MPGIAGIVGHGPADYRQETVLAMVGSMKHERFYESGVCLVPEVGVYAGYTAHEDSMAAHACGQGSVDGVTVLLSGDCIVDSEPLGRHNAAGAIVRMYREMGDDFVGRLSGLFSVLLIDHRQRRALLFNDRYGIERIYVHQTEDATYFASEAKALLSVLPQLRTFDDAGVAQYLALGCTLGQQTLFKGIRLLDGGSLWSFQQGRSRQRRYFTPDCWETQPVLTEASFESRFQEAFRRVLPRYLEAGSRIGVSLTGGLDTRMIMAGFPKTSQKPVCYTFSGLRGHTLDERLAAKVSAVCGLEHHVLRVGTDFLADYARHVDRTVWATDGSSGALGAHEIYLNALARRLSPVRLTGNFGSEILRSMSTFKPVGLSPALFRADFGSSVAAVTRDVPGSGGHPVTFAAFQEAPWSLFGTLAAARTQVTFRTPYLDNELVALAYQAPAASRRSPNAALHLISASNAALARIPTDRGLVDGASGPGQLMRRAVAEVTFKLDYWYTQGLPDRLSALERPLSMLARVGVLGLHKYLPYRHWFRQELSKHVSDVLTDPRTSRLPYWNAPFLTAIVRDHLQGRRNYVPEINAVITMEAIDRLLLRRGDGPGPLEASDRGSLQRRAEVDARWLMPAR